MIKQKKENNDREEELEQEQVWNRIKHILSDFTIAGTYYRTQEEIFCAENLQIGEELVLEKEPTNEFDKNAIKVLTEDGYHIGYIPKELCRMFNDILVGCEYRVLVNKIVNASSAPYVHVKVEILDEQFQLIYFCYFKYYPHICKVKHIRSVIRTASFG